MPSSNVCWGIEIGSGAIKGIKLERDGAGARVTDFLIVPHKKPLSTPDLDQADAIRVALGTFLSQKDVTGARVAVSVPGHMAFARFAKLPPVEPKKVPDIVKFEAVQQIPFPIEEVEWDYQTFTSPESPDVEVGIFAITREKVLERLALLAEAGLEPDIVTISPVAAYNAMAYDLAFTEKTPGTIIVDIGGLSTDLLVADAGRVWIRTFPIGGHNFTEAIADAFKLNYPRAEKLKREIEQSQHKRHMFQAMKGVFEDLAQDVQRSLQYYQQLHPEAKLERLVGLGSTWELPGLRKFVSQRLQLDVVRLEQFSRINVEGAAGAEFQSSAIRLATAYGCALQGLGLTPIDANLIPVSVVREAMWKRKMPWFAAAAGLSIVAGAAAFVRPMLDRQAITQPKAQAQQQVPAVTREGETLKKEWDEISKSVRVGFAIANLNRLLDERELAPMIMADVGAMLASADPQPEFARGAVPSDPPDQWRLFEVKSLQMNPVLARAGAGDDGGGGRGQRRGGSGPADSGADAGGSRAVIEMSMVVETSNANPGFVNSTIVKWLTDNRARPGMPFRLVPPDPQTISRTVASEPGTPSGETPGGPPPASGTLGAGIEDMAPLPAGAATFPPTARVYRYQINWKIEVLPPGQTVPDTAPQAAAEGSQG
ncbi:MAG: type IV pilus assembly protein PilM [Phycisphaerales bacterium]|nr:type IV pilus assembly protein PilM [Phycisphaerales bacterium]